MNAFPVMLGALCVLAIGYRYYSAFIASKVLALDDSRKTPAHTMNDGSDRRNDAGSIQLSEATPSRE